MTATHEQNSTILTIPVLYFSGFAGSGLVFGFREAVADSLDLVTEHTGAKVGAIGPGSGFAGSGLVFGFREAVADSLDLVTEHTGAKEGAIGPANQVAHAVRMGQPESRRQLPERHRRQLPRQPGGQIPAHRAAALPQEAICDDPIVLGQGRQGRGLRWLHPGALDVRPPERLPVALEGRRHDHGAADAAVLRQPPGPPRGPLRRDAQGRGQGMVTRSDPLRVLSRAADSTFHKIHLPLSVPQRRIG